MIKRIKELENSSRNLEPDKEEWQSMKKATDAYAGRFLDSLPLQKAYTRFDSSVDELLNEEIGEEPRNISELIRTVENRVIPPGLNPASGGHLGYIPGGGLPASALADYLAAVTNPYAGIYFSSPGAVLIEKQMIQWMAKLVGYPPSAGGYLSSGGSLANLTAIVTAREAHKIKPAGIENSVVYLSGQTHHCVDRALNIAGMGECVRRYVPMDRQFRMETGELKTMIEADLEQGLKPWMVVASAGTTDAGAVDSLDEIAEIISKHNIWFHVDAAYGGFFLLTDEGKKMMKGIEKSDSAVLDPHKGLFIPYGLGALIVRDQQLLAEAHTYQADYMQDTKTVNHIHSPADLSPELSKHFRSLRMWLPLKLHGVGSFRAALEEKMLLARYAWQKISEMDGFETGPAPQLSVFMFRYNPGHGDVDEMNREIHRLITDDGRIFFSTTKYKGNFMLRLAVLSFRTHLDTIDQALQLIKEKAEQVSA
ncbi:MAG: aminotransferase class V-fold PLP-dependent enzyme [Balneolaceae bacterium]|nr:MAG: aminotransferase class V-fold PLP-dependent enzyme [Balneolaceae bacterium]